MSSPLMRLLNVSRSVVPLAWRPTLRNLVFSVHPVTIVRPSGLRLRIADDTDWVHYTEIFRKGEYDSAIDRALATIDDVEPVSIVDLGANVGFFTLRAVEKVRMRRAENTDVKIIAFEASERSVDAFRARVIIDNELATHVRIVRGLVGNSAGTAIFYEGASHGDSSLFTRGTSAGGTEIEFVDVSAQLADEPTVHLIKCDIEGAELQFIRNFPDLLRKTRVGIFELHDDLCDTDECLRLLRACGFLHQALIRRAGPYSVQCVWR
ncbi:MAG TPA: FkbM family methyltransferase [Vicinamibacterales bacterium]|nr:FkbM family methyltransferase [Vicinamibacterales bacterium]